MGFELTSMSETLPRTQKRLSLWGAICDAFLVRPEPEPKTVAQPSQEACSHKHADRLLEFGMIGAGVYQSDHPVPQNFSPGISGHIHCSDCGFFNQFWYRFSSITAAETAKLAKWFDADVIRGRMKPDGHGGLK